MAYLQSVSYRQVDSYLQGSMPHSEHSLISYVASSTASPTERVRFLKCTIKLAEFRVIHARIHSDLGFLDLPPT